MLREKSPTRQSKVDPCIKKIQQESEPILEEENDQSDSVTFYDAMKTSSNYLSTHDNINTNRGPEITMKKITEADDEEDY